MSRVVQGQVWASPCPRPACIPHSRPRGVKAVGLRYEWALAKALPSAKHGPWYEFTDQNGPGYCQPDCVWDLGTHLAIFEAKLSNIAQAEAQLKGLYLPVLQAAHKRPVVGIIVVRHLSPQVDLARVVDSLGAALNASNYCVPVLHWLGRGRL